jgi:uncharacterized protein YraI
VIEEATPEPQPTDTPEPTPEATAALYPHQAAAPANLRSGPGTNFAVTGALQSGDSIRIVARNENGDWFLIQTLSGTEAWLAAFLVDSPSAPEGVPVAAVIPTAPTNTPTPSAATTPQEAAPVQPSGQ